MQYKQDSAHHAGMQSCPPPLFPNPLFNSWFTLPTPTPPFPYQDVVCVNQNVGPIREADLAAVQDVIRTVPQVWNVCVGCSRCGLSMWGAPGVACLCGLRTVQQQCVQAWPV